jgi:hypothetical protein
MARGWESKSVEEQMETAREERNSTKTGGPLPDDREMRQKREGLLLQRTRILQELASARNPRYRALLTETLHHLDDQLQA